MDKNIKWLKDNGIIRHVGPAKGGRWEVIGKKKTHVQLKVNN